MFSLEACVVCGGPAQTPGTGNSAAQRAVRARIQFRRSSKLVVLYLATLERHTSYWIDVAWSGAYRDGPAVEVTKATAPASSRRL